MLRETARAKTHTQQPTREVKESGKKREKTTEKKSISFPTTHTHTHAAAMEEERR